MKDLFSSHARQYAACRPTYPDELIRFMVDHCSHYDTAWDCGTGNGQLAAKLADHFKRIHATDISARQIENAKPLPTIQYHVHAAERTDFKDHYFDLITVAQAAHWFDISAFYEEVNRVARSGALLALIGYRPLRSTPAFNEILDEFYFEIIYPFWDAARRMVDDRYESLDFPFAEIKVPTFQMDYQWTPKQVEGYLSTWSSVKKYIHVNGVSPVIPLMEKLEKCWTAERLEVYFPIFSRMGFVNT